MKTGPQRNRRAEIRVVRYFECQHRDRDEAVAEASRRFIPIAAPLADPSIFVDQSFLVTHLLVERTTVAAAITERLRKSD